MIRLGLLGKNIAHSRSQEMYEKILGEKIEYTLFDYHDEKEVPSLNELYQGLNGLSITSPYKKTFINSPQARLVFDKFPAVNCVYYQKSRYELYNTDYLAVRLILKRLSDEFNEKIDVVVLGNGNMAQVTSLTLREMGVDFTRLARSEIKQDLNTLDYGKIFTKKKCQNVLINCCSRDFIFRAELPLDTVFWDHNYALEEHASGLSSICDYRDGVELLELQAYEALKVWGLLK